MPTPYQKLREKSGLTQQALAHEAGLGVRTVQRIEADGAERGLPMIIAFLAALGYRLAAVRDGQIVPLSGPPRPRRTPAKSRKGKG